MVDSETSTRLAVEAVGAAMRTALDDDQVGRVTYATMTDHERTLLADAAARMAHRSPLVRAVAPGADRDTAQVIWRFTFGRAYLLHLSDLVLQL